MSKFNKNEMFCPKCLVHDTFFTGGGSWSPDSCPKCGDIAGICWESMSFTQKRKAKILFEEMWQEIRVKA